MSEEFMKGNFVFHESDREFSGLALDQAHEHNNAFVKEDGGAVVITENTSALLRWMTSGPQISQLIKDFGMTTKLRTIIIMMTFLHHINFF